MGDVAPSRLVPPFEVALEKGVRAFLRLSPTSWLKASKGHLPNEWGGRRYKAGPACERPFGDRSGRLPCMRSGRSPLSRQARAPPHWGAGSRSKASEATARKHTARKSTYSYQLETFRDSIRQRTGVETDCAAAVRQLQHSTQSTVRQGWSHAPDKNSMHGPGWPTSKRVQQQTRA